MTDIKVGVTLDISSNNYDKIKQETLECEKLGYYSAWVYDHFFPSYTYTEPLFECWTILSALASVTHKIRLGSLVLSNSYRIPSVLAKMSATLDVISKGRLEFGFGAGWKKDEYLAYGIAFPKTSVRIAQMKEAVTIIKKMWTEEKPTFHGEYYHIKEAFCNPKPFQKPHPPIWIGGSGERLLLRAVAEQANGWNMYSRDVGGLEECKHKLEVLRKHCIEVKRDYNKIEKSWFGDLVIAKDKKQVKDKLEKLISASWVYVLDKDGNWITKRIPTEEYVRQNIVGTPEECINKIQEYSELGFNYFIFGQISFREEERKIFAEEVMPTL